MSTVTVLGAGLTGLTTALLLARDGHDVTVLERDPAPPPADPLAWQRRGVAQFRLLHIMLPRWRAVMAAELPEVLDALVAAGGVRTNLLHLRPPAATGGRREGDERFDVVTGRRPVVEAAVAAIAERAGGIRILRGVAVDALLADASGAVPLVTGVRAGGRELASDVVVDALGRRSPVAGWVGALGGRPPARERADLGFVYYARHFRAASGVTPTGLDAALTHHDSVSVLTLPADNGVHGVAVTASARDRELRGLRDPACWDAAIRLFDATAPWLDGEPVTGVDVMAGIEDRHQEYVVDGTPAVTGLVAVGDAWACTNPSLGRGASMGAVHAQLLRDVLAAHGTDDADTLVRAFADATATTLTPYLDSTLVFDRHRLAEIEAEIAGVPYRTDDRGWAVSTALAAGAAVDPELARVHTMIGGMLATPGEVFSDAAVTGRVLEHAGPPRRVGGPTREELVATVAGTRV